MAADPTLADRLEARADRTAAALERNVRTGGGPDAVVATCTSQDVADDRAAAVRLRKLDAAITDVRAEFAQALSDDTETSGFLNWIERLDTALADALGGTEP